MGWDDGTDVLLPPLSIFSIHRSVDGGGKIAREPNQNSGGIKNIRR